LNALTLPRMSRKYVIAQTKKNADIDPTNNTVDLYELYGNRDKLSFENVLASIVHHIFIKKERPKSTTRGVKNDFILTFADKIKRHCVSKYDMPIQQKKNYNTNNVKFGDGGSLNGISYSIIEILKTFLKDYPHIYRVFTLKQPEKYTLAEMASLNKPTIAKRIKKGKYYYRLTSSVISQNKGRHMVCGFVCGDKEYIYNSNLKVAVESNWSNHDFENYTNYYMNDMKELRQKAGGKPMRNINLTPCLFTLIYTIESESDHKELLLDEMDAENVFIPDFPCKYNKNPNPHPLPTTKNTKRSKSTRRPMSRCKKPDQELVDGKCLKICKPGQMRNMITKRCVNINRTNTRRTTARK
jgi:hypothetical protein